MTFLDVQSEILGLVEKPVRYIGNEWNQIVKEPRAGRARVAIAFPDTYEIGMSHLGMRILYDLLNADDDIAAERVFCPWVDMEAQLRRFGLPLSTLENRSSLAEMDVIGFSLQFEMEYSNVLTMLDLGGVPLRSADRGIEQPLVIAGGPCVFSPEPMADFIDVFVIGDGEEAFPAVVKRWQQLRAEGKGSRQDYLQEIAQIRGMYVPSLYRTEIDAETGFAVVTGPKEGVQAPFPVRRTVVDDINRYPFPSETLVPYGEIVHDRVSIEIARGCTEGCRFCQAGIIYRPVRERSPEQIIASVAKGLQETGYNEVSLTSLSTADYSCVTSLVKTMMDRFEASKTAMSVSSMRVYGLTRSIAEQLARVRKTGFTIAPEAGTQRMRDLINKGVTDEDIEMAARIAWGEGWKQLKMYFMIGLPSETDEDVRGIAETGIRVYEIARSMKHKRAHVTVSASALVPKPHSTFQWEAMGSVQDLVRKQKLILETVKSERQVRFKYHDVEEAVVECILSRGDRRLGRVIERAWRKGARYDSWSDHFDYERWMTCIREEGLEPEIFLRKIPIHASLPWDHIDSLVTKEYLIQDLHKGMKAKFMPACEKPFIPRDPKRKVKPLEHANLVCYDCGLECDLEAIKNARIRSRDLLANPGDAITKAFEGKRPEPQTPSARPVRLNLEGVRKGDRRTTNAYEAASGTLHGEGADSEDRTRPAHASEPGTGVSPAAERPRFFYRVRFEKRGHLRWLSHLDLMRTLQRAFQRANIPVTYSHGYHPQPIMSFGPALPVGIEGHGELFDFETSRALDPADAKSRLRAKLPPGLDVLGIEFLPAGAPSLAKVIELGEYRAQPNEARRRLTPELFSDFRSFAFEDASQQQAKIDAFLRRSSYVVKRSHRKGDKEVDIRPFVHSLSYLAASSELQMMLRLGSNGQARPQEVLQAVYSIPGDCFRVSRVQLGRASQSPMAPELAIV